MSAVSAGSEVGRPTSPAAEREDTGNAEIGRGPNDENVEGGGMWEAGPALADTMRRCGRGGTRGLFCDDDDESEGVREVGRGERRAGGEQRR